jgi:Fe-S-cluster containining protein
LQARIEALEKIYHAFEQESAPYRGPAACDRGCAYCCTDAGRIDCTTLEALRLRDLLQKMPRPRRRDLQKALQRDMRRREAGKPSPCPFLTKTKVCGVYDQRPFACRRITSLHRCSAERPPMLSRRVMERAAKAIADLQRLDRHGYSGHLSFILHLLDSPRFRATYQAGDCKPEEIMAFGRTHGIVINRMVT